MAQMVDFRCRLPEDTHEFYSAMSQASEEDMQQIVRNVLVAFHQRKAREVSVMARILRAPTVERRGTRAGGVPA